MPTANPAEAKQGNERRSVDAQETDHDDKEQEHHRHAQHRQEEGSQGGFHLPVGKKPLEEPDHVADDPAPDVKDQNSQRHPDHSPYQSPHGRIDDLIERHGFQLGEKRLDIASLQRIDRLGNGRQLGLKLEKQGQQQIHGYSDIFYTFIFLFRPGRSISYPKLSDLPAGRKDAQRRRMHLDLDPPDCRVRFAVDVVEQVFPRDYYPAGIKGLATGKLMDLSFVQTVGRLARH